MPSKRPREEPFSPNHTRLPDVLTSHDFLSPNEYSSATIGLQSFLTRQLNDDHFTKFFRQLGKIGSKLEDYLSRLDDMEKKMSKEKSNSELVRCAIINRLRTYLNQDSDFQKIINQIETYREQCMSEKQFNIDDFSENEFLQDCEKRTKAIFTRNRTQRIRRFHFYDHTELDQPENVINLKNWIMTHFQWFVNDITLQSNERLMKYFNSLLSDSFLITQHPSPPVVTYNNLAKNDRATANIRCRLLCLLDLSNETITVDKIVPIVRCLTASNRSEESVFYTQRLLGFNTCSVVTALGNDKTFFYAELSQLEFNPPSTSTGKIHYAQHVYFIDFEIHVKGQFPNHPLPYKRCIVIRSAPFGLVSNTAQVSNLYPNVYLQDLSSWKQLSLSLSVNMTNNSTMLNLTVDEIVKNLHRYFIHTTGIKPGGRMMLYIREEIIKECQKQKGSIDVVCHDFLAKILAQIDCMAEHPLLTLFYSDGLFLGICDSMLVCTILQKLNQQYQKSFCAIRFSSINNMPDAKNTPVRVDLFNNSSADIQNLTLNTQKISLDLVSFIVQMVLGEASCFEHILLNGNMNKEQCTVLALPGYIEVYYSDKLRDISAPEEKYKSIWNVTEKKKKDVSTKSPANLLQDLSLSPDAITTTEMPNNNPTYPSSINTNSNINYGIPSYQPYYTGIEAQLQTTQQASNSDHHYQHQYQMSQNPQYQIIQQQYQQQPQLPQSINQFQQQQYYAPQSPEQYQLHSHQSLPAQFQQQQPYGSLPLVQQQYSLQPQQQQLHQSFPQASPPLCCTNCQQPYSSEPLNIIVVNQGNQSTIPEDILRQQIALAIPQMSLVNQTSKIIYVYINTNHSQQSNPTQTSLDQ